MIANQIFQSISRPAVPEDPTPLPSEFDELASSSTNKSLEKPVPAPQHVQSSVTTTPHIQTQAPGRECFVMQMLYVCVLFASCSRSQCCILHDLQFVNAGRGCKRRPYRRGIP